ncbi:MAG: glucose 1-dehydrogenase [Chloroflexi bacterium]|nr:glucose 1-dehydrogenase [Chloroflexota bacterium]MCY3938168.1 glucose 1-dehydrogenase [Chloroflexota bacterium]
MSGRFEGKVVMVTGGGSGMGEAASLAFAREGAQVIVVDLDPKGGSDTVTRIERADGQALYWQADVSSESEVESAVRAAVDAYGALDCAFNNAGFVGSDAKIAEYLESEWDRLIDVNLKGVWLCMKYQIRHMLAQGGGAIVNNSSALGLVGGGGGAYAASKHAVVGLTKTAALEYARDGIRINAVCPGPTATPPLLRLLDDPERRRRSAERIPMGRLGQPSEIAEAVLWLCSDAASFVTGSAFSVDGGHVA